MATPRTRIDSRLELDRAAADGLRTISNAADSASKVLSQSASDAVRVLSEAAAAAAKVVAEAAAVSARVVDSRTGTDHDAILRIEGSIKGMEASVKNIEELHKAESAHPKFTAEVERRIAAQENADAPIQLRLNYLEKLVYGAAAVALIAIVGAIVALVVKT